MGLVEFIEKNLKRTTIPEHKLMSIYAMVTSGISKRQTSKKLKMSQSTMYSLFYDDKRFNELIKKRRKMTKNRPIKSQKESSKKTYNNHKKIIQDVRSKKNRILTVIANEVCKEPTKQLKNIFDGVGKWSENYDMCIQCNSNMYLYMCRGLCKHCYLKNYRETMSKSQKIKKRESGLRYYKKNHKDIMKKQKERRSRKKNIFKKVQSGKIETNKKIDNLIKEYEKTTIKNTKQLNY